MVQKTHEKTFKVPHGHSRLSIVSVSSMLVRMITDIILGVIILGMITLHFLYVRNANELIDRLTKKLLAKDLTDYTVASKIESEEVKEEVPPEFIPEETLDDKKFDKLIQGQIEIQEDLNARQ